MFFAIEKFTRQIQDVRKSCDRQVVEIAHFKYWETGFESQVGESPDGPQQPEFDDQPWADFRTGDVWGGYDRLAWFRTVIDIPEAWRGQPVFLRFETGPQDGGETVAETLLYVDGHPLQALDMGHEEVWLPDELAARGRLNLALKAWSGVYKIPARRRMRTAEMVLKDATTEQYAFLCEAVLAAIGQLAETDLVRVRLVGLLDESLRLVDFSAVKSEPYYRSICSALKLLRDGLSDLQQEDNRLSPRVVAAGHAHIDMAWLWRVDHSREKAARTFSTALHLMRRYPHYHFLHSSPQLYKFLKHDYPNIFEQVKGQVRRGQWEVVGGMWVEADTNLTSGESLIRQFLYGRRFVRAEFGVEMATLWLPDVFGYSAALPQIILKCGLKYFLTTKISWNQFNRFPHDTFLWRGLDGSEVLTYFVTTPEENTTRYTYNGQLTPAQVQGIWQTYRQREVNAELLTLFGLGDGGGGPTREMLESGQNLQKIPALPNVVFGKAEDFMARLEQRLQDVDLPVWDGELYLEYHRGTYTSQAANKRANRQAEILFHNAEWLSALADILGKTENFPFEELRQAWETILLLQFHDILPGSSIHPVYEDCARAYAAIQKVGQEAVSVAKAALLQMAPSYKPAVAVFNPSSWQRGGLCAIEYNEAAALAFTGLDLRNHPDVQLVDEDGRACLLLNVERVPAMGYRFWLVSNWVQIPDGGETGSSSPAHPLVVTPQGLENRFYHITLNEKGQIVSIWDKDCAREVLASEAQDGQARGNILQTFDDRPLDFNAWDIDIYYQEKMSVVDDLISAEVIESGPLRGVLRLAWNYRNSRIQQDLTIYRDSRRIDFKTLIDWQEQQTLLKAAFDVDIRATRATYEIQFGSVERPTHWNTSWDWARFEVVGQRWADLSEGDYGVALLNDCKYGYDIKNHQMRLTLVKSGIDPDPQADQGLHFFTYSLFPHAGDWRNGVIEEAYALNFPLLTGITGTGTSHPGAGEESLKRLAQPAQQFEFVNIDPCGVILETLKRTEDGSGWIVRFYEAHQARRRVCARFGLPLTNVQEVNMVEEDPRPAEWDGNELYFSMTPFEVKTFRVWF